MARNSTTMNISLPANLRAFVDEMVAEGDYASASSVLQEAVRLLQREREAHQLKIEHLRALIDPTVDDYKARRGVSKSEFLARRPAKRAARTKRGDRSDAA